MIVKFDKLMDVPIADIDLDDVGAVSRRIGKIYNVESVPVSRVTVFPIKGKLRTLLPEIHVFQCVIPVSCVAVENSKEIQYYWMHNVERGVLFPVKPNKVESMISTVYELLAPPEELKVEIVKEKPEVKVVPTEPDRMDVFLTKGKLSKDIPVKRYGKNVYDKRWLYSYQARMRTARYKMLASFRFLSSSPEQKVDDFNIYLIQARSGDVLQSKDIENLGIDENYLDRYLP